MKMSMSKASNLIKAANSYKLPSQLTECLIASGYDSVTSVAQISELSTIETFFRTNSNIFSTEEIIRIYGRFASTPEKFNFLPGHHTQLMDFIDFCKTHSKENKSLGAPSQSFSAERGHKRQKQLSFKARPVKIIKAEDDKLAILAQEALNPHAEAGTLGEVDESEFATIYQSSDENELILPLVQADGHPCAPPTVEQASFLAEVYTRLQNRIKNWCLTNTCEEIQRLKFRIDYLIHLAPVNASASLEEKEKSLRYDENYGCQVHVNCLACNRIIRLHPQRGGFCTSNVFRHFVSCRVKKSKKGDSEGTIQFLIRTNPERSSELDEEVQEESVDDGNMDLNDVDQDQKEQHLVQEMIYVTNGMVEGDSDDCDNKHMVRIALVQTNETN